jgi:pre-mRNA-processing factor 6
LNGELWSLAIELEPKNTRKKKSADAVTLCVDNPHVYLSTAKIFLKEGKIEKARRWLEKALILEPRLGDAWAYLYLIDKEVLG